MRWFRRKRLKIDPSNPIRVEPVSSPGLWVGGDVRAWIHSEGAVVRFVTINGVLLKRVR